MVMSPVFSIFSSWDPHYISFFIAASGRRGRVRPAPGHHPAGRGERRARQPAGARLRRQGHQELCH